MDQDTKSILTFYITLAVCIVVTGYGTVYTSQLMITSVDPHVQSIARDVNTLCYWVLKCCVAWGLVWWIVSALDIRLGMTTQQWHRCAIADKAHTAIGNYRGGRLIAMAIIATMMR